MNSEEERVETFLNKFKELEHILVGKALKEEDDYVSFSKALNEIYYSKSDPVISDYENYSFLRMASDIRNILSHNVDSLIPTVESIDRLDKILRQIKDPLRAMDVCSKDIVSLSENESLSSAIKKMKNNSLSHLPIMKDGKVVGVFSRSTVFDYLSSGKNLKADMTMIDFSDVTGLSKHHAESFVFVSKKTRINAIYSYLVKREVHEKNVALVFVTQNGKKEEDIYGIITSTDLLKYHSEEIN